MKETVAAGIIFFKFIRSAMNLADILTKPLSPVKFYALFKQLQMKWKIQEKLKGNMEE